MIDHGRAGFGHAGGLGERWVGVVLLVAGVVGGVAAFVLTVERFRLLENPFYVPSCSLSAVLSCKSVMQSAQASAFGVPNSLLGLVGFSAVATIGGTLAGGMRLSRWLWATLGGGLVLALGFVHWLLFQTLYRIGALCPYCIVVWACVFVAAWYVMLRVLPDVAGEWPRGRRVTAWLGRNHLIGPIVWFALVGLAVYDRFWAPW